MRISNLLKGGLACLLLASIACADAPVEGNEGEPPTKSSGTLTLDGKAIELRHVYAFRTPLVEGAREQQMSPSIQLVLANEPVPDALLQKIEEKLREGQRPSRNFAGLDKVLKGTPLRLLILSVPKKLGSEGGIQYDPAVCLETFTAKADESPLFGAFSVREGKVRARASHTWNADVLVTGADGMEDKHVDCSFDVDFEVAIGGTPVPYAGHPTVEPMPPLVPGKATGTFRTEKGSTPLTTAYARRRKTFFDEPEEIILVAITNKPLADAARVSSLDELNSLPRDNQLQGVRFTVSQNGSIIWSVPYAESGIMLSTNVFELSECRIEGERVIGRVRYRHDKGRLEYTVEFDVPITAG